MNRLILFRFAALIVVRDILTPLTGLFLLIYGWLSDTLEPWHAPLITAMIGTPLVARPIKEEKSLE